MEIRAQPQFEIFGLKMIIKCRRMGFLEYFDALRSEYLNCSVDTFYNTLNRQPSDVVVSYYLDPYITTTTISAKFSDGTVSYFSVESDEFSDKFLSMLPKTNKIDWRKEGF